MARRGSDLTNPNSLIYVTVYDRSQDGEGFLGMKEIKPVLRDGMTVDNWFTWVRCNSLPGW